VLAAIEGHLAQIEADDAVISTDGLLSDLIEHARLEPLVPAAAQGGLRPLAEAPRDIPGAPRDQAEEDGFEAIPVRDPWSMASERVLVSNGGRHLRFNAGPDGLDYPGFEREH
jgi:hypothetical protein